MVGCDRVLVRLLQKTNGIITRSVILITPLFLVYEINKVEMECRLPELFNISRHKCFVLFENYQDLKRKKSNKWKIVKSCVLIAG